MNVGQKLYECRAKVCTNFNLVQHDTFLPVEKDVSFVSLHERIYL